MCVKGCGGAVERYAVGHGARDVDVDEHLDVAADPALDPLLTGQADRHLDIVPLHAVQARDLDELPRGKVRAVDADRHLVRGRDGGEEAAGLDGGDGVALVGADEETRRAALVRLGGPILITLCFNTVIL